jgi:Flp pilus assembly protein TadG
MIEVALVLPIFIFTLMAVIEMGYFVAVASAVGSASREGARYGATWDDGGTKPYLDCPSIRAAARQTSGALVNLTDAQILIAYDDGSGTPVGGACGATIDDDLERWDRIQVTVNHTYEPLTPLLRALIGNQAMQSIDRRSIVKP